MTSNALRRLRCQVRFCSRRVGMKIPILGLPSTSEPSTRPSRCSNFLGQIALSPLCSVVPRQTHRMPIYLLFLWHAHNRPNRNNSSRTAKIDFTSCHTRRTKSRPLGPSLTLSASHAQLPPCSFNFIHMQGAEGTGCGPDRHQDLRSERHVESLYQLIH